MSAHSVDFHRTQPTEEDLAEVVEAKDGRAVVVQAAGGDRERVDHHLSHVAAVHSGDTVLIRRLRNRVLVLGRLAQEGEAPAAYMADQGESILLAGGREIRLSAGQTSVLIHADGRVEIDGETVRTVGREQVSIEGARIDLN